MRHFIKRELQQIGQPVNRVISLGGFDRHAATQEGILAIDWCRARLPRYQLPRYVAMVDDFEKTATLRIKKESLSRLTTDCWDRERP